MGRIVLVVLALVVAGGAVGYIAVTGRHGGEGRELLLLAAPNVPAAIEPSLEQLRDAGFKRFDDLNSLDDPALAAVTVTRARFDEVPSETWRTLHGRGVVILGIDVAANEIAPLVRGLNPTSSSNSARLTYTPERPLFSLVARDDCSTRIISDWLGNFDLPLLVKDFVEQNEAASCLETAFYDPSN